MTVHSRDYAAYRNPIYGRGWMHDGEGRQVTARVQGGPADGIVVAVHHTWVLGRKPVALEGSEYRLETDIHGFVCVWLQKEVGDEP